MTPDVLDTTDDRVFIEYVWSIETPDEGPRVCDECGRAIDWGNTCQACKSIRGLIERAAARKTGRCVECGEPIKITHSRARCDECGLVRHKGLKLESDIKERAARRG